MFDPRTDPLGIGLQQRARDHRQQWEAEQQENDPFYNLHKPINSLPNPMWDGLFQAMDEQGVSGVADNSVGVAKGMFPANPAPVDMHVQQGHMQAPPSRPAPPSMGNPLLIHPALNGLKRTR